MQLELSLTVDLCMLRRLAPVLYFGIRYNCFQHSSSRCASFHGHAHRSRSSLRTKDCDEGSPGTQHQKGLVYQEKSDIATENSLRIRIYAYLIYSRRSPTLWVCCRSLQVIMWVYTFLFIILRLCWTIWWWAWQPIRVRGINSDGALVVVLEELEMCIVGVCHASDACFC